MDYLLCHADEPSGDSASLTWWTLAMMHAPEIENEMISKGFFREDPIVSTELLAGESLDFIVITLIIVISHQTFWFANFLFKFAKIAIRFAKFLPGLRCLPYGLRNFQVCLRISS